MNQNDIVDWEWGMKFNIAGFKEDRSDLKHKNFIHYVRVGTAMIHNNKEYLPYINVKFKGVSEESKEEKPERMINFEKQVQKIIDRNRKNYNVAQHSKAID